MTSVPPPDIIIRDLRRPGKYLKIRIKWVKLPFVEPPRHVPSLLLSMVRRIVEPFGWQLYNTNVIYAGGRTGEFVVTFKATGTVVPGWAILALVGTVVAGVVIYYIHYKVIEQKVGVEVVREEREKVANANKLFKTCVSEGGDPNTCAEMVRYVAGTPEYKYTQTGGFLEDVKGVIALAIVAIVVSNIARR